MKQVVRILVVLLALAEGIAWTDFTFDILRWANSFKGAGDGAGAVSTSGTGELLGALLTGVIWLLPVSPYLCMVAGSLKLLKGNSLFFAYWYSLIMLFMVTMTELFFFQRSYKLLVLGNIVVGVFWAIAYRGMTNAKSEPMKPLTPL